MEETLNESNNNESTIQKSSGLSKKAKRIIIIVSVVMSIAILGIFATVFPNIFGSEDEKSKANEFSAWPYARNFLSQYVKFSDTLTILNQTETVTEYTGYNLWTYKGDFTAENAYGTKIRHNFIVIVKVTNENSTTNVYKYYLQIDDDVYFS